MFLYRPPEKERKIKSMPGSPPNRQKEEAMRYLSKGWVPVNGILLKNIKRRMEDVSYVQERESLISDVQSDPALFLHCCKALRGLTGGNALGIEPLSELRALDSQKIKSLFNVSERDICTHSLKEMDPKQAACLQYTLLSTHTTSAIAQRLHFGRDLAFSSAAMRQLGHLLMAWNYPRIYAQALALHRKNKTHLEVELKKLLGFTPAEVNAKLAAEWGMHAEIRHLLPPEAAGRSTATLPFLDEDTPLTLRKLCILGELFARTKDPVNFPEAQEEWKSKEAQIAEVIGLDVFTFAEKHVEELIENFTEVGPAALGLPLAAKYLARRSADKRGRELMLNNSYLQHCPEHIQTKFMEMYSLLEQNKISLDAIHFLFETVVPMLGFRRGCLFLLNPKNFSLEPVLRIGDLPLSAYRTYMRICGTDISAYLQSKAPIRRDGVRVDGDYGPYVCGPLAHARQQGVLYLEINKDGHEDAVFHAMTYFQAVRRALNDSLGDGSVLNHPTRAK